MPGERFKDLVALMARLRAPGGCPWDREQTFDTIKPFLLEETYEVVDAIDRRDFEELKGELGDLLLQIVFFSQMAAEEDRFSIDDVVERIHTKMVRRHPHVFGEADAADAAEVLRRWDKLKAEEQRQHAESRGEEYRPSESVLDGVADAIPSLLQAYQLQSRASFVGFDWPDALGVLDKVEEEVGELREVLSENDSDESQRRARLTDEIGDLLFAAVNAARFLKIEPESALRRANEKFRRRFQCVEARLAERGRKPAESNLDEMEAMWQQCKRDESAK
jgi:MazG family protein